MAMSSSSQWAPVDCVLCPFPHIWRGAEKCPGCNDLPERGAGKISRFKIPGLYVQYPELAHLTTQPEMKAVRPEEDGEK
jgi:hypothetical protein